MGQPSTPGTLLDEPLLDVHQAAELLSISVRTVYEWCERGELPHYRLGGRIRGPLRFKRSELHAFLEAGRRGPKLEELSA